MARPAGLSVFSALLLIVSETKSRAPLAGVKVLLLNVVPGKFSTSTPR